MTQTIAVSKSGKNVLTATSPNDFIFHSSYNAFKIIASFSSSVTVTASSTETKSVNHGLGFVPFCFAFAKKSGSSKVYALGTFTYSGGLDDYLITNVYADSTKIYVVIENESGSNVSLVLKIYAFSIPS